jgi:hypothetical protein
MQGGPWGSTLHTRQSSTKNNKYQASINTVVSPDDGPIVARNMLRSININILRKTVHKFGVIYKITNHPQCFILLSEFFIFVRSIILVEEFHNNDLRVGFELVACILPSADTYVILTH